MRAVGGRRTAGSDGHAPSGCPAQVAEGQLGILLTHARHTHGQAAGARGEALGRAPCTGGRGLLEGGVPAREEVIDGVATAAATVEIGRQVITQRIEALESDLQRLRSLRDAVA